MDLLLFGTSAISHWVLCADEIYQFIKADEPDGYAHRALLQNLKKNTSN